MQPDRRPIFLIDIGISILLLILYFSISITLGFLDKHDEFFRPIEGWVSEPIPTSSIDIPTEPKPKFPKEHKNKDCTVFNPNNSKFGKTTKSDSKLFELLINCVNPTDMGLDEILKTNPSFSKEEELQDECGPTPKDIFTMGCHFMSVWGTNTINILGVKDENSSSIWKQAGAKPTETLVHETLHGVYNKLNNENQKQIFANLENKYPKLKKLISRLGYPNSQIDDELFVRVGSEYNTADCFVAGIYAKYFKTWSDYIKAKCKV